MDAKEARKIHSKYKYSKRVFDSDYEIGQADGYLEGMKAPSVVAVIENAKKVIYHYEFVHRGMPVSTGVYLIGKLEESVSQYLQATEEEGK